MSDGEEAAKQGNNKRSEWDDALPRNSSFGANEETPPETCDHLENINIIL